MIKNSLFGILLLVMNIHLCAQQTRLRLYNLNDNSILDSLEVVPWFEDCEITELKMHLNTKKKFYYYKPKVNVFRFKIANPDFVYPEAPIQDAVFSIKTDTCRKGICHFGLLPTTRLSFYERDTSSASLVNVAFKLKTTCSKLTYKMFHEDKWVYMGASCYDLNDTACAYSFEMRKDKHVFYFTPDNNLEMHFRFSEHTIKKNIAMSVAIEEVKIYVDQKMGTVVVEEIKR